MVFRQQAITWGNFALNLCRHMASPDHNELRNITKINIYIILAIFWYKYAALGVYESTCIQILRNVIQIAICIPSCFIIRFDLTNIVARYVDRVYVTLGLRNWSGETLW